jgi:hypothetical protein
MKDSVGPQILISLMLTSHVIVRSNATKQFQSEVASLTLATTTIIAAPLSKARDSILLFFHVFQ